MAVRMEEPQALAGDHHGHDHEERLFVGRQLRCPRCRRLFDILRFIPMERPVAFEAQLNWLTKCPGCRFVFSPVVTIEERFR